MGLHIDAEDFHSCRINGKLGGVNSVPVNEAMKEFANPRRPTMVLGEIGCLAPHLHFSIYCYLGADVSHPGPGEDRPSTAALVSSYDMYASQYAASISVQQARTEIIADLQRMMEVRVDTDRY